MGLTPRQSNLFGFIRSYKNENDVAPTYGEMAAYLDLRSKSGIARLVEGIEERGLIRRLPNKARAIEIVAPVLELSPHPEVMAQIRRYATAQKVSVETIACEALRSWFGGAE